MKELVAKFLFSALQNLFHNQPDLSNFTSQTEEREPNLSFHLANELWPYLCWLQCDFDVTKPHLGDRRPDMVFHRRSIHALNFLAVEVKRRQNPKGTGDDVNKIKSAWFGNDLHYRFGASVLIDEEKKAFLVQLMENVAGAQSLIVTQHDQEYWQQAPNNAFQSQLRDEIKDLVCRIVEAEQMEQQTGEHKLKLDKLVLELYGLKGR